MASLRLVPVSGLPIDVVKDQSVVGRDPSCEIVVSDGSVSRRHARLERRAGAWWVVDQGSANGTYLNSLRIAEQALKHGQELRFGALAYRVDLKEDPEATVATPIALVDNSATVMAQPEPAPPAAKPAPPPPLPKAAPLPPLPAAAPPSAAAAKERFKPTSGPSRGGRRAGATDAGGSGADEEGQGPARLDRRRLLRLPADLRAHRGRGRRHPLLRDARRRPMRRTPGSARSARARPRRSRPVSARAIRSRVDAQELEHLTQVIASSKDATFPMRSVDNDRATLTGVLTGGAAPQPVVIRLVKEGGGWKVDGVTLGTE